MISQVSWPRSRSVLTGFQPVRSLGRGTFGTVTLHKHQATDRRVAIKKFEGARESEPLWHSFCVETDALLRLRHPNIVSSLGWFVDDEHAYIVLEPVPCNLRDFRFGLETHVEDWAKILTRQLMEGLDHAHSHGIIHGDIKPANILVGDRLRIADWGLATEFSPGVARDPRIGTLCFRAPEVMLGDKWYTPAVDMWAVGCVLFFLLVKEVPFCVLGGTGAGDEDEQELVMLRQIFTAFGTPGHSHLSHLARLPSFDRIASRLEQRPAIDPRVFFRCRLEHVGNELLFDLLAGLLQPDPSKRLTAQQALEHPYFEDAPAAAARVVRAATTGGRAIGSAPGAGEQAVEVAVASGTGDANRDEAAAAAPTEGVPMHNVGVVLDTACARRPGRARRAGSSGATVASRPRKRGQAPLQSIGTAVASHPRKRGRAPLQPIQEEAGRDSSKRARTHRRI